MKDVAAQAGLHQTTVSLALRNHPGIPERTRARIRAVAARLGYRRDPALDAFNFHRLANRRTRSAPALAVVSDAPDWETFEAAPAGRELMEGLRTAATRTGFQLDRFLVGPRKLSALRLNQILRTRNTTDVVVATQGHALDLEVLDWAHLCAVRVESFHLVPAIDAVAVNHRQAATLAVENLRRLGYRRIGLAGRATDDERLAGGWRIGFLTAETCAGESSPVPPLLLAGDPALHAETFRRWILDHALDAVVVADSAMAEWRPVGVPRRKPPAFAVLDLTGAPESFAGVVLPHRRVGEWVIEWIALRRQMNQRGLPAAATQTLLPVEWRDGESAPARIARRAVRRAKLARRL